MRAITSLIAGSGRFDKAAARPVCKYLRCLRGCLRPNRLRSAGRWPTLGHFAMELHRVIEALLYASDKPLPIKRIHAVLKSAAENSETESTAALSRVSEKEIRKAIDADRKS